MLRAFKWPVLVVLLFPAALFANQAPVIDGFTVSETSVLPGGTVTLAVDAHDPDCAAPPCDTGCGQTVRADLTLWSATGGTILSEDNGTTGSPYAAGAVWQAPVTEDTHTLDVTLSDSGSFICGGRASTSASLEVRVTSVINDPPVVDSLSAERTFLFPGDTSRLTCMASDSEGDPLTYSWQTDRGAVTPAGGTATLTAGDPGIATVTCTATDPSGGFGQKSIGISVKGALAERAIGAGLLAPQRLAIDSFGDLYVVDGNGGGISVVNLESGEAVYALELSGVTSVAVDWSDQLLVGGSLGADVRDRSGNLVLALDPGGFLGEAADVAIDSANQRYGVLYGGVGRVVVFDAVGTVTGSFGSTGDGPEQFRSPRGLAVTPAGEWAVADSGSGLIKVFTVAGSLVRSFGGLGGGAGEFVSLDDVAVGADGIFYASDSFQDWVQSFHPDGTARETFGTYGNEVGQFVTPSGLLPVDNQDRLVAASLNTSSLQVFRTSDDPVSPPKSPAAALSPSSVEFPVTAVGAQSSPVGLTLGNAGDAPLGVRSVSVVGDFTVGHDCGLFLDPGGSCTVSVRFGPTRAGAAIGSLSVDTSDPTAALEASLTGEGFAPASVTLSGTSWQFADQEVGTSSEPRRFLVNNLGTVALDVFDISVIGPYLQTNTCASSVPAGGSCAVDVTFVPEIAADHLYGSLTLTTSAPDSPHVVDLDGRGVVYRPTISILDGQIEEGDGPPDPPPAVQFRVELNAPVFNPVTVDFATTAGSAVEGVDFVGTSGAVTIGPGETSAIIAVEVVGDGILEPDEESFSVALANAVNGDLGRSVATGSILDDELCPGADLVINGAAEEGSLIGWTPVNGPDWSLRTALPDPLAGDAYFAAADVLTAELAQDIDLAAFAEGIDDGSQWFVFDGWLRTAGGDTARIILEYLDGTQTFVLDGLDSGELASGAEWLRVEDLRAAPPGARWLRIRLIGDSLLEDGTEAYFDSLSVLSLRVPTLVVDDAMDYEGDVAGGPGDGDVGPNSLLFVVRLACPYWQRVYVDYQSADGTAVEGQDYLAEIGTLSLQPGAVAAGVFVELVGDEVDEGHETMKMVLANEQPDAIALVDGEGLGIVINDDFCQRSSAWWSRRPQAWPAAELVLGGVSYGLVELAYFLDYGGPDEPSRLARELVAAHFNLLIGSEPSILPVVEATEAFLAAHPPESGDQLDADERATARDLLKDLDDYQKKGCPNR